MANRSVIVIIFFMLLGSFGSCQNDYSPKPRGYFRIKFPAKTYREFNGACPFTFKYPAYATIEKDTAENAMPCWMNIVFPSFNARIYLSYYPVTSKKIFNQLVEDARTFAFKHTVRATAIDEALISQPEKNVYGILYTIDGNSASAAQFFLTDSTANYMRGALYFNEKPRLDSIQPVLDFIKQDIQVMIKSVRWN